jgi:hypothetical protein
MYGDFFQHSAPEIRFWRNIEFLTWKLLHTTWSTISVVDIENSYDFPTQWEADTSSFGPTGNCDKQEQEHCLLQKWGQFKEEHFKINDRVGWPKGDALDLHCEVLGSNLGRENANLYWRFPWVFSVRTGKYWDSTSISTWSSYFKSFQFIYHPTIRRYII